MYLEETEAKIIQQEAQMIRMDAALASTSGGDATQGDIIQR